MLDDRYLASGLAALARVRRRHWNAGHYGAAVLAAYFFAEEQGLDAAAAAALAAQLDRLIARHPELFAPPPDRSGGGDVAPVAASLRRTIGGLHAIGHNVIFATLALKACARRPELATPDHVAGLVALLDQFDGCGPGRPFYGWDDPASVRLEAADAIPRYDGEAAIARTALAAFARVEAVHPFLHQGIVGHLLTHAHALIDLARGEGPRRAPHRPCPTNSRRGAMRAPTTRTASTSSSPAIRPTSPRASRSPAAPPSPKSFAPRIERRRSGGATESRGEGANEWLPSATCSTSSPTSWPYVYSFYDLLRHVGDAGPERRALEAQLAYVLAPAQA